MLDCIYVGCCQGGRVGCPCQSVVKCFVWLLDQESAIQMQDHLPFVFCEVITWHVSVFADLHQCEL